MLGPVLGSIGGAIGSYFGYRLLNSFRKSRKGKLLENKLEECVHCFTCQTGGKEADYACPVFISFKVNEASREAAELQAALRSVGVRAYVCNAGDTKIVVGENWEDNIMLALQRCSLFVVLGTKNYAEEGAETVDSKAELRYALLPNNKKKIIVIKLTDTYNIPYAQVHLDSRQSLTWPSGKPLPAEIVPLIVSHVQVDESLYESESVGHQVP